jgi:hypothetical protein
MCNVGITAARRFEILDSPLADRLFADEAQFSAS